MKVFIEIDDDDELRDLLVWRERRRKNAIYKTERQEKQERFEKTEIGQLDWPYEIKELCKEYDVETIEQAKALKDKDWLKMPRVGRVKLTKIKEILEQHKAP